MNRRGPAQRALESCRRKDETEVNLVRFRVAILRECSAREAVVETVDYRVAQRPDVAHRESFWMVQRSGRARIEAEAARVQSVTDRRVICRIALGRSRQYGECLRVYARTGIVVE